MIMLIDFALLLVIAVAFGKFVDWYKNRKG
jgi:hypothetical protein